MNSRPVAHDFKPSALPKSAVWSTILLSVGVTALWAFPKFWYTRTDQSQSPVWLTERASLDGWRYREVPISEAAEAVLGADRIFNGEFSQTDGTVVRVYSAKRYQPKPNEIGLFSHTPDRCWTSVGWKIESAPPDVVECAVQGMRLSLERRIYSVAGRRELLYFGALVGGQPLPYRLDQYLSAGRKRDLASTDRTGTLARLTEGRMWSWLVECFLSRRPLSGPQQYIRISTAVGAGDTAEADRRLIDFLSRWLTPVDYHQELAEWRESKS